MCPHTNAERVAIAAIHHFLRLVRTTPGPERFSAPPSELTVNGLVAVDDGTRHTGEGQQPPHGERDETSCCSAGVHDWSGTTEMFRHAKLYYSTELLIVPLYNCLVTRVSRDIIPKQY